MMALAPSSNGDNANRNTNNEKEEKDNALKMLSFNPLNTRQLHQRTSEENIYEQLYQLRQSRNSTYSRSKHSEGKSVVSIDAALNDRNHQPIQDSLGLQLPLIETHQQRPIPRYHISRKTSEPLGVLPLKRRRNPFNYSIPSTSDDAKQHLLKLAGHETIVKGTHSTFESLPSNTHDPSFRIRTYSREESNVYEPLHSPLRNTTNAQSTKSFNNRIQKRVPERLTTSQHHFLGYNGKERAAILIQSYWRGFRTRCIYKLLKKRKRAVHIIASAWLTYSKLSKIRKQLNLIRQRQLDYFHIKQNELREKWSCISSNRRIIVHIPSLGLSQCIRNNLNHLSLRENYQVGRLCELDDPNVNVIYVSPMSVNDEILQYYNKLINLRAMVEQGNNQPATSIPNNVNERFKIIVPESLHSFPKHNMCLATLLKYSPKALKQIKNLIQNQQAYLVSGTSHIDDLYIAEYLDIPIYGCEPEVSYLYSTKSGSKRIFKSSNVPMPFGEYDIYDLQHLLKSLAQLIIEHLDVQRWIFKIDDHFDGLGIAYCDIATYLSCYQKLMEEARKCTSNESNKLIQNDLYAKLLSELPDILDKHTIYVNKAQFNSWQSYLKVFLSQGGIIEAYPPSDSITSITICLSIEPNGQYSLLCSGDQLHAESQFSCWGLAFPQSSVDPKELNNYCLLIAEQCQQRHIYGYVDIDFITFIDGKTDKQNIWVTDLSIGYSEHLSLFHVMKYITTGQFNSVTHSFIVKTKQPKQRLRNWQNGAPEYIISEKNCYAIWSSRLYHTNLSNIHYSIFFEICRSHGIGFDIRERQGSIFTLLESNHHEHIGMITISDTLQNTLTNFICNLNAMNQEITAKTEVEGRSNFMLAVNDIENIFGLTKDNDSNVSFNTTTS
ncbi:unnamed protein product [Adineta steineri]|uniref:IQCH-like ATP-grasp domain-containing protein n=1 Tax=Adineta steineri TaxID=433720 RepID=A0A814B3L3_9BILA|nr:unnamed protein product [Adineta steineri]